MSKPQGCICKGLVYAAVSTCKLHSAAPDLADALAPLVDAFHADPGTSDLDDEQPIHISTTLGQWRSAVIALRKAGYSVRRVEWTE